MNALLKANKQEMERRKMNKKINFNIMMIKKKIHRINKPKCSKCFIRIKLNPISMKYIQI
jgi:hypothetical protein